MTSISLPVIDPADLRYSNIIARAIDNTALSTYTTCPRKFLYSMLLHRRKDGPPTPSLGFGSAWHVAMETHYKYGSEPADLQAMNEAGLYEKVELAVATKWQESTKTDDHRTLPRLLLEYRKYLKKYGLPWREDAKTVGWPEQPMVEIATELPIPGARHPYTGKIDRIIKLQGQYYVEDHKSGSQMRGDFFQQFSLDNQMIGYATLAWLLTSKIIAGVRINGAIIRKNDSVFERQILPFTAPRMRDWMRDYDAWLGRIENSIEARKAFTDEQIAKAAEKDDVDLLDAAFPHNWSACAGKYGMCTYAGVCSYPPRLRQRALEDDFQVVPWNPLEAEDAGE